MGWGCGFVCGTRLSTVRRADKIVVLSHGTVLEEGSHQQVNCTLQHTATYCKTLQHAAARCNTLQHTATRCNTMLQGSVLREGSNHRINCNTLQHIVKHCNALQHTVAGTRAERGVPPSCKLQHTATCCNAALQRTTTHCNALQRTAAHCRRDSCSKRGPTIM